MIEHKVEVKILVKNRNNYAEIKDEYDDGTDCSGYFVFLYAGNGG